MLTHDALVRLCRARDRLRELDGEPLSMRQIAREAAISPYHVIRQYKALFGETPHQTRIGARLDRARERLVLGQGSVTDICMDVGFSSLGSFSALFSKRFGESPSAFRKRLAPTVEEPGSLPAQLVPDCVSLMNAAFAAGHAPRDSQFPRSETGP